jgi:sortase A
VSSRARKGLAALIAILAIVAFGRGAWIHVKAELAQVLLARAWARAQAGDPDPRPWPWADTHPVARLISEDRGVDLYVLSGASGRTMAFGPGFLESSAKPGTIGNTIFAAHRDTHFAFLRDVVPGEAIVLETPNGARIRYRIEGSAIRDRKETDLLRPEKDAVLTLITCYPFDAVVPGGPLRFVVRAKVAPADPGFLAKEPKKQSSPTLSVRFAQQIP